MGEVEHETSQDSDNAELQVPRLVQLPGTADRPTHSLNFRLTGVLHQRPLGATAAILDLCTLPLADQVN